MPSLRIVRPSAVTPSAITRPLVALGLAAAVAAGCTIESRDSAEPGLPDVIEIDANDLAAPPSTTTTLASTVAGVEVLGATAEAEAEIDTDDEAETAVVYRIVDVPRGLNLRAGPGGDHAVLAGVEKDRLLTATGGAQDGWVEVTIDGLTGWVVDTYLESTEAPAADSVTSTSTSTTTTAAPATTGDLVVVGVPAGLNLRSGPGLEHPIVTGAPVGETVTSTGVQIDGWLQVTYDGVTGWATADYLAAP